MAGKLLNIKVYCPLKPCSSLAGKKPAICHYSYNLPLFTMDKKTDLVLSKLEIN